MNPYKGLKNIPRNIWLVAITTLINRAGTMVLPFLALYLHKEIGVTATKAGMVLMFYGIGALITSPFVGRLADKVGPLKVMRVSLISTGILLTFYSFIKDYHLILIITLVWAVISEAFRPANLTLISFESSVEQRKTAFALNRLAINLGMSIGPVVGGFLSQVDYSLLFYVDGATSIIAGLFLTFIKFDEPRVGSLLLKEENSSKKKTISLFRDKPFIIFMIAMVPVGLVFFQHLGGYPLYIVNELKYSEFIFGLITSINTIIIVFVEVPLNNAMSNWDDRSALALGSILAAIGFGIMALSPSIYIIILSIIIWTFGEMIYFPSSAAYSTMISPEEKRGEYMGYYQMVFSFLFVFGPWIGAFTLDKFNSTILWSGTFVAGTISSILFLSMKRKSKTLV